MTREEAIKWMEEAIQDINTHWDSCSDALQKELNEQREVFLLAIDAILHANRKQKLEAENMELKERIINWRKHTVPTREQVEKVWRGEWIIQQDEHKEYRKKCSRCGFPISGWWGADKFCANCGAPMTDEAVQMVMERLEKLKNEIG